MDLISGGILPVATLLVLKVSYLCLLTPVKKSVVVMFVYSASRRRVWL